MSKFPVNGLKRPNGNPFVESSCILIDKRFVHVAYHNKEGKGWSKKRQTGGGGLTGMLLGDNKKRQNVYNIK